MRTNEIENEIEEIKNWEEKIRRKDLVYKTNKNNNDFEQYETKRYLGDFSSKQFIRWFERF